MSRGIFTGRCYLCGEMCGRTYCHEHKWAAGQLAVPDRPDPSDETIALINIIERQEQKLEAWRRTATRQNPYPSSRPAGLLELVTSRSTRVPPASSIHPPLKAKWMSAGNRQSRRSA